MTSPFKWVSACLLCFAFGITASAQIATLVSERPEDVAVTIYPQNLAMISETRTVELPAGRSEVSFEGVSDLMMAETALLTGFGAISIERNFDYNLISKPALFEAAIGETVTLTRTLPGSGEVQVERAIIVSGEDGVVFKIGDRYERFQCAGLSESVQFDGLPDGFYAKPTLSLIVEANEAGPQTFEFRYLTSGLSWKADYVLSLSEGSTDSLTAWLTLSNESETTFQDADVSVIAGSVAFDRNAPAKSATQDRFIANCIASPISGSRITRSEFTSISPVEYFQAEVSRDLGLVTVTASRAAPAAVAEQEDLGDYKLYKLPFRTTLSARQTKQAAFLYEPDIQVEQRYAFDFSKFYSRGQLTKSDGVMHHAINRYEIDNDADGNLAKPMPAGTVRVMTTRENGYGFKIGDDTIENIPIGQPVEIDAGYSSGVAMSVSSTLRKGSRDPDKVSQEFINLTDKPALVEFELRLKADEELADPSIVPDDAVKNASWRFTIPAGSTKSLTYRVIERRPRKIDEE